MNDEEYLKQAFAIARRAGEKGNLPFGAILVNATGDVVFEAENTAATSGDCTGHAELNLVRAASRKLGLDGIAGLSIYTSCEPCCMCSAAIVWGGLGRIVFGLSSSRLGEVRSEGGPPMLDLPCREVIARSRRDIAVVGPLLEDEAATVFNV